MQHLAAIQVALSHAAYARCTGGVQGLAHFRCGACRACALVCQTALHCVGASPLAAPSWRPADTRPFCYAHHAGRDLQSVLQLRSARSGERVFGWWRSGRRIAVEVAKALAYLHRQVG